MNIILRWSGDFPGIFINYTLNTTAMSKLDEIEWHDNRLEVLYSGSSAELQRMIMKVWYS
jgi:hypothetical protein